MPFRNELRLITLSLCFLFCGGKMFAQLPTPCNSSPFVTPSGAFNITSGSYSSYVILNVGGDSVGLACHWSLSSSSFINVTSPHFGGGGSDFQFTINFSVAANPDLAPRTGFITITQQEDNTSATVRINQSAASGSFSLLVNPTSQTVPFRGGTTYNVSIERSGQFAGCVALNAFAPSGITANFIPNMACGSTSTMTVSTPGASPGSYAIGVQGLNSGTGQSASANLMIQPPPLAAVSITPSAPQGASASFVAVYQDPAGGHDVAKADLYITWAGTIDTAANISNACVVRYEKQFNTLMLVQDNVVPNTPWSGPTIVLGTPSTISNSQCTISGNSSVAFSDTDYTFTLNLNVTFSTSTFAGPKSLFADVMDSAGTFSTNWNQRLANFTVDSQLSALQILPSSAHGSSQVFTAYYYDANGVSEAAKADFYITSASSNTTAEDISNACIVRYDRQSNKIMLVQDTVAPNAPWEGPTIVLGTPGAISNSQCTISGNSSAVFPQGDVFLLNLDVAFNPSTFAGPKSLFADFMNSAGTFSNNFSQRLATFTVQ